MMRQFLFAGLSLALLLVLVQAGAAKPQPNKVKRTASPVSALAMDGPRVAYMMKNRKVVVWNVGTGAASVLRGNYFRNGAINGGSGEVAIAGKRVALITRFSTGNLWETKERIYTATVGGVAHQLGKPTDHSSYYGECSPGADIGGSSGNWLGGLVGAGNALTVSSWRSSDLDTSAQRLRLVTPTGLRTIATGRGTTVSQSASGGQIAILRSTQAWPAYQGPTAASTPMVGIYSTHGRLLHEINLDVQLPDSCGSTPTFVSIALQGSRLVVLRVDRPEGTPWTSRVEVYAWRTGALMHTWPLTIHRRWPNQLAVSGRVAVIEGSSKLQLLDLTTGKQVAISASQANSLATIGSRGLVYANNPYRRGQIAKLVFVPTANLLAMVR